MERLPLRTEEGGLLALGQVAKVKLVDQVNQIAREDTQRRVSVLINVRGRDTAGFVAEATRLIREKVKFPDGYYFEFGGQFKNLQEAKARLTIVVPLALALIFVLIFLSFGSLRKPRSSSSVFRSPSPAASSLCAARHALHHLRRRRIHRAQRHRRAQRHHAHQLHQPTPRRRHNPARCRRRRHAHPPAPQAHDRPRRLARLPADGHRHRRGRRSPAPDRHRRHRRHRHLHFPHPARRASALRVAGEKNQTKNQTATST